MVLMTIHSKQKKKTKNWIFLQKVEQHLFMKVVETLAGNKQAQIALKNEQRE